MAFYFHAASLVPSRYAPLTLPVWQSHGSIFYFAELVVYFRVHQTCSRIRGDNVKGHFRHVGLTIKDKYEWNRHIKTDI